MLVTMAAAGAASYGWMTSGDGEVDEIAHLQPGKQGSAEKMERAPTREMPPFDSALADSWTEEERRTVDRATLPAANNLRAEWDRPPVEWSDNMAYIARRYSRDRAVENYGGHTDPNGHEDGEMGPTFNHRLRHFGYKPGGFQAAENALNGPLTKDQKSMTPTEFGHELVSTWELSSSHRNAIIRTEFEYMGTGTAFIDRDGKVEKYSTMILTGPLPEESLPSKYDDEPPKYW